MPGDLMAGGGEGARELGVELQRLADGKGGQRQAAHAEQFQDAPHAGARAVFIHPLDAQVALSRACGATGQLMQPGLGLGIAIEKARLRPFLDVEYELHRDTGLTRPARMGWATTVTDQVACRH